MKTLIYLIPFILLNGTTTLKTDENTLDTQCYWEETFGNNLSGTRGDACGSDSSLRLYFTNPYSYKVRVAFYLRDEYGNLNPNGPWVVSVNPGRRTNHHKCYSNGRYIVLAARADSRCRFPDLN